MELKGKRILVTGGTGFVGSHLVQELVRVGSSVVVPYRSLDPHSYFSTERLMNRAVMAVCDLKDRVRVEDIVTKYEIEFVFHLAAQPIVTTAYANPVETIESNVMGTVHVLEACRKHPEVKGVIVASSDKAYGKCDAAYTEDMPLRGDHPYEVSKSAADLIAQTYHKTYGLPVVITRFGNIYGEGDLNYNRIVPGIMKAAAYDTVLALRSDGQYRREYIYVSDVTGAYLHLYKRFDAVEGRSFNIGTGVASKVVDLIGVAGKVIRRKVKYTVLNTAINEIPEQRLDAKAIRDIGWKPKYDLLRGLTTTWKWYARHLRT